MQTLNCFVCGFAQALKALHDRNLIHLDVKLENIMITDDNVCKLGDFGLVVDLNKPNLHQSCEGDSRYIAPELMQAHFTKAADIFSFGITALELVCNLDLPNNGPLWVQLRNGTLPTCLECECANWFVEIMFWVFKRIFPVYASVVSPELQSIVRTSMHPAFGARPSVDALLRMPRFVEILAKRRKFEPIRRLVVSCAVKCHLVNNQNNCPHTRTLARLSAAPRAHPQPNGGLCAPAHRLDGRHPHVRVQFARPKAGGQHTGTHQHLRASQHTEWQRPAAPAPPPLDAAQSRKPFAHAGRLGD